MEGQENLDNQEELKKEETPENNVQEEIVENKETEEKKEDNDKTVEEDSMKFKKAEPSKKQKSNKVIPIVVSLFIVLFVMIFSVVFALFNMNNEKILKGISILGIDISDLTVEEAKTKINNAIEERFKDENNNLILKIGENETSVTANTFNAKFDIDNAVIEADNIGRNGNILTNNYSILFTKLFKKEIKPRLYLDDSLLSDTIKDINSKMKDAIVDNSYYIEKNNLIIVKGKAGYIIKTEELKEKKIKRKYIALVSGVINHDIGEIDAPIGRDPSDRKKMCVTSTNSKDAITHFRVLERYKNASLIECELETGRTHQIRVHMKYINHPVINDPVYGKSNHGEFGQLLHAKEITFTHPTTKEVMTFSCEVPEEFNKILEEYKEE